MFSSEEFEAIRCCCLEMTRKELDIAVLTQLSCGMQGLTSSASGICIMPLVSLSQVKSRTWCVHFLEHQCQLCHQMLRVSQMMRVTLHHHHGNMLGVDVDVVVHQSSEWTQLCWTDCWDSSTTCKRRTVVVLVVSKYVSLQCNK